MTAAVEDTIRRALALREGETIEVVSMPQERGNSPIVARAFTIPAELDDATAWAAREASRDGRTVSASIGCLTPAAAERINSTAPDRWLRSNARRAAEEGIDLLLGYRWVAVDLDPPKDNTGGDQLAVLLDRLTALPAPTVLISSGHGVHAWWRLTEMLRPNRGRMLLGGLAAAVEGDNGATQSTRALRLPGTYNSKPHVQRHAVFLREPAAASHDALGLHRVAAALAPAPPVVEQPARPPRSRPSYDGADVKERVRARYDLAAELERLCGPARRGDWSCFAHEDRTPSLRLVQGAEQAAVCYGGGHPDGVGLMKDGYYVLDVFDLLAWENKTSTARLLHELIVEEIARQPEPSRTPAVDQPGLPQLDVVLRRTVPSG